MFCGSFSMHSSRESRTTMFAKVVTVALAIDIVLICLEGALPGFFRFLPLGGSSLSQLGLVLGLAVALCHIVEGFRPPPKSL